MELSTELINLFFRFSFNLSVAYIIIKLIYHRDHNNNDFVTGSCEIVSAYGHATTQGVFDYAYVTNQFVGDLA